MATKSVSTTPGPSLHPDFMRHCLRLSYRLNDGASVQKRRVTSGDWPNGSGEGAASNFSHARRARIASPPRSPAKSTLCPPVHAGASIWGESAQGVESDGRVRPAARPPWLPLR